MAFVNLLADPGFRRKVGLTVNVGTQMLRVL